MTNSKSNRKFECSVCGKEIFEGDYEDYDGLCWACWDNRFTEECDSMFGELM